MTPIRRRVLLAAITIALVAGSSAYAAAAYINYQSRAKAASEVATVSFDGAKAQPRIVFRNTAPGSGYGLVATVPLADTAGPRALTQLACDRVYATQVEQMCLHVDRGVVTTFNATLFDSSWEPIRSWPLPGIPSRTRISADSQFVASTSFVTGHSYATVGFSTHTVISMTSGEDFGNLEEFRLFINGKHVMAADRNIWGVTFANDSKTFYATAASGSRTWLVRGDLDARTLTAVKDSVECPSLSPDGTLIAYKKDVSSTETPHWSIAVLDLESNEETVLAEDRNVDDQVEWLDTSTLLYGLPRSDSVGDSDVWAISTDPDSAPRVLIEHAWSPAVVQ